MKEYRQRIADKILAKKLDAMRAVVIEGAITSIPEQPKTGKVPF